ncbi:HNH endonuclease [Mesorhizobium sp. M0320]|uniref:hypothetical protein n=1 Tax=Mesorhizobium sp. M0320 TaxID=2956936 RepID=UPI003338F7C1
MSEKPADNPVYPPVGRCIYCGATRYSPTRLKLGDEHIIPEALDGKLVLPEASCFECERSINWFEHYCLTKTFGPMRYALGMRSKRPQNRPKTLPLELLIGENWVTKEVPIDWAPVMIFMPVFDPPEILAGGPPTRQNIYTAKFLHRELAPGDEFKLGEIFAATKGRSYKVSVDGIRFALQVAKIAHGYAFAERSGLECFNPVLTDTILRRPGATPLPYLIGGLQEIGPPSPENIEITLRRGITKFGVTWLVDIRLFPWIGAPTYRVVVSVENPPPALQLLAKGSAY